MESITIRPAIVHSTGMMTRKNASIALGVKPKTMCHWASRGLGPRPVKVGGRISIGGMKLMPSHPASID